MIKAGSDIVIKNVRSDCHYEIMIYKFLKPADERLPEYQAAAYDVDLISNCSVRR